MVLSDSLEGMHIAVGCQELSPAQYMSQQEKALWLEKGDAWIDAALVLHLIKCIALAKGVCIVFHARELAKHTIDVLSNKNHQLQENIIIIS